MCPMYGSMIEIVKNRTVADALREDKWIMDLRRGNSLEIVPQAVQLQRRIKNANPVLREGIKGKIALKVGGQYTARSAYNSQFPSQPASTMKRLVWKIWALGK